MGRYHHPWVQWHLHRISPSSSVVGVHPARASVVDETWTLGTAVVLYSLCVEWPPQFTMGGCADFHKAPPVKCHRPLHRTGAVV